ncbi:4'-phosphopantetheinyl transferase family protein [Jannaschia formosa]|uniref:4'-phosphopantetheinyl transferase family protein n=1 Tax=Jannaschia formosa TaxID=2259592 RepID=UPI000E1BD864|nr:4'-phosphopantetheinyl transferase superfamily protein [Jannaschia formosa]TFL18395.1 4'-phosphopantetheinyl transferase superfamily protein [Jannaschia formosa]
MARLAAHLSPAEAARAARFARAGLGNAFRVGRGRMREILARWTGSAPDALQFEEGAAGKPRLQQGPCFNLSHSAGIACLAVHPDRPLGVDIEAPRPVEEGVAARFFSAAERAELAALSPELWRAGFFRCWTRKEAVVKALGLGMGAPLDRFDVTLTPGSPARVTRCEIGPPGDWHLTHLSLPQGIVGAVALRGAPLPVTVAEAPPELCCTPCAGA